MVANNKGAGKKRSNRKMDKSEGPELEDKGTRRQETDKRNSEVNVEERKTQKGSQL